MREDELQRLVMQACARLGLAAFHDQDSRRNNPGFPDTVIAGRNGVLWRELKTMTGRTRPMQDFWIGVLQESGADVAVWRPADWPTRIMTELQDLGRPRTERPLPSAAELRRKLQGRR